MPIVTFKFLLSTLVFIVVHRDTFPQLFQYITLKDAEEIYIVFLVEMNEGKQK